MEVHTDYFPIQTLTFENHCPILFSGRTMEIVTKLTRREISTN